MQCIAAPLILGLFMASASARGADPEFDVDVTLTNDFDKDLTGLPVFVQVFRVFGRGVDYAKFNRGGFHVYDDKGAEVPFMLRPVPPDFSLANDEIVLAIPKMARGESLTFRFTNTSDKSAGATPYDVERLLANANNQVPNGGFEKGAEGWTGGKVVTDAARSGKASLLLEAPGSGGQAALTCDKPLSFVKGRNYYFAVWARCENVVRRTWRYHMPWALAPISGRITLSGDPLIFPEYDANVDKNHLIRLMDNRDWYSYGNNVLSTLCVPAPALNTCQSTLSLNLAQEPMPYLDAGKPARIWIDEVMLFEQPAVAVSWERIRKKLVPDGFFFYRRAPTCLSPTLYSMPPLDPPRPCERIKAISESAALGERKTVTLGIHTPRPIQGLCLEPGDLAGPDGASLGTAACEIEFYYTPTENYAAGGGRLEGWVIDGNAPRDLDRPGFVDYLLGYRIAAGAVPGGYRGAVKVKGDGRVLGEIPLELEIVPFPLKVVKDRFAGLIWNAGCGPERPGVTAPGRGPDFYRYYSRCNFTYLMIFGSFLPFRGQGTEVDIPQLAAQVREIRDLAGVTAGVGLYPDCRMDGKANGLWPRSGNNPEAYRARAKEMDEALAREGLPRLVYMIWDEPRSCDPAKFGILKGTGSVSTSDICFKECLESIRLGLFTHPNVDGPGCDYGPMFRRYARACGGNVGWDNQYGPLCHRYQTSLMLPHGASGISTWHSAYYIAYHPGFKAFVRNPTIVGAGEGMIDFRYFETLKDAIAAARARNAAKPEVEAAEKYLKEIMDFCTDDFHFMSDKEIFTYNGGPERWGDDWFYERWRTALRNHTLAILARLPGGLPGPAPRR